MGHVHEVVGDNVPFFDADEVVACAIEFRPIRNIRHEIAIGPIHNVADENGTLLGCQVIETSKNVVLVADVRIIHKGLPGG